MKNFFPFSIILVFPLLLQAQYPSLDPSFNEFKVDQDHQIVLKVQPNGKILVLERDPVLEINKISRREKDGSIDDFFGIEGSVHGIEIGPHYPSHNIPSVLDSHNYSKGNVFIQEDQKIILVSSPPHNLWNEYSLERPSKLLRLDQDGNIDNTFGENGYVDFNVPLDYSSMNTHEDLPINPFIFADLGFQSDGKISGWKFNHCN